jgi:hypothetical protein
MNDVFTVLMRRFARDDIRRTRGCVPAQNAYKAKTPVAKNAVASDARFWFL